jgi:hypothetical protein
MPTTGRLLFGVAFALLCGGIPAAAQEPGLMLGGGGSLPVGAFGGNARGGYGLLAAAHIQGARWPLGVRLDVQYFGNPLASVSTPTGDFAPLLHTTTISAGAEYRAPHWSFALFGEGVEPYAHGGATWGTTSCTSQMGVCDGVATPSGFGFNLGVGFQTGRFYLETRYLHLGGEADIALVPIGVGLRF